ncbi:hypothetical protein [Brachyspira innocens]|uniref:alginate O-acetyltransferase AlgX-related protein n=1 Tax=Brachyspira innocens TaxID=13264 RepID=UPI0026F1283A|nr:hypothetical protein [Brachyspira innocens]
MKNKSLFNKISLLISIVILFLILILSVLGSFNRVGYLSEFKLISSKKNIYTYNFRIKYHSKVFRNSDIYGVYINSKNIINANKYIRKITMNEIGSPFGILESNRKINGDIDNIVYTLKLKKSIIILSLVLVMILLLNSIIIDFIKKLSKFNFRNRYAYILIIFLCFLIIPSIIYKIFYDKFDHTNYEKRSLAKKPVFSINNLYKYPSEYEKYFNDYIPFRNELIQKKVYMDLVLFNNFVNTRHTLIGKEDWLFMKWYPIIEQYIGKYMFTDNELEIAKQNLLDLRDKLMDKNIDLVVMIIPEKSMVYDNYLPDYIQKTKYSISITEQLVNYIKKNTDIKIVYPKNELIKYRDKYQLYYKYDDHWNNLGGYIGYSQLMKSININLPSIDNFDIYKTGYDNTNKIMGIWNDLIWLINLPQTKKYNNQYNYYISNFTTNNYKIIEGKRGPHESLSCISDSLDKRHITIIRDSYTCAMFDYLASSFYETTFIYTGHVKNKSIPSNTDILFIAIIERTIKSMFLNRIKSIKID